MSLSRSLSSFTVNIINIKKEKDEQTLKFLKNFKIFDM